jgi:sortase A
MIVRVRGLRIAQSSLWICALASFGYCAYAVGESWIFQTRENHELAALSRQPPLALPDAVSTGLIGRIEIPRLDVSVVVMEGSTDAILRHAAGHIAGTALPGQPGNVGVSAHRDTFFRPLRNIRKNDLIRITTLLGSFRYRVVSTEIVPPDDLAVLKPGKSQILTLVTCYPFYFVGPAPERFIVRAERVM